MDATCSNCPFWAAPSQREQGLCQRLPPQWAAVADTFAQPLTSSCESCGEHPLRQRDRLAAMALPAVIREMWGEPDGSKGIAGCAYQIADAMLAEAAKGKP